MYSGGAGEQIVVSRTTRGIDENEWLRRMSKAWFSAQIWCPGVGSDDNATMVYSNDTMHDATARAICGMAAEDWHDGAVKQWGLFEQIESARSCTGGGSGRVGYCFGGATEMTRLCGAIVQARAEWTAHGSGEVWLAAAVEQSPGKEATRSSTSKAARTKRRRRWRRGKQTVVAAETPREDREVRDGGGGGRWCVGA
ncbi:hypothetical protein Scep_011648 [Stephania cephalantha]|uniref:Uncharacterized protein n=1 Tax=Stephania cephalantha TaxID=152367 RepID=A0AAP0JFP8_9MAGN